MARLERTEKQYLHSIRSLETYLSAKKSTVFYTSSTTFDVAGKKKITNDRCCHRIYSTSFYFLHQLQWWTIMSCFLNDGNFLEILQLLPLKTVCFVNQCQNLSLCLYKTLITVVFKYSTWIKNEQWRCLEDSQ